MLLYDTKVGERWGHNYDLIGGTPNGIGQIWQRPAQNCEAMIAAGLDPLRVVCEHAHSRGMNFLAHLLLNLLHQQPNRVTNGRQADFTTENPELTIGADPQGKIFGDPNQLSYAHAKVRMERLAVIKELLSDYPTDGVEINFVVGTPLLSRAEVVTHTDALTEWMRDIKKAATVAAVEQGRDKRVVVRVPATLSGNSSLGHDLCTWITEGLIDTVVAVAVECPDFSASVSSLRELATLCEQHGVRVIVALESTAVEQTELVHRAAIVNAYSAGASGVLFHRWYPGQGTQAARRVLHPYSAQDYERLRFAAYPDIQARRDKTFRLGPVSIAGMGLCGNTPWSSKAEGMEQVVEGWLPLPLPLSPCVPSPELPLEIADDISAAEREGMLWRCELIISIAHLAHSDLLEIEWNNTVLSVEDAAAAGTVRKADWSYQMRPSGVPEATAGFWGYRLHVDLKRNGMLPICGRNHARVRLLDRDPQLQPVEVRVVEVQVVVEYLSHKNGIRDEEDYYRA